MLRVSNREYHNDWPEISSSQFKPFYQSPSAFRWPLPREDKECYQLGTALHSTLLEPDNPMLVQPSVNFATKAGKTEYRQWLRNLGAVHDVDSMTKKADFIAATVDIAVAQNIDFCSEDQYEHAKAMALSVSECEDAITALEGTDKELSFRSKGRKARPDAFGSGLLIDIKTTSSFDRFKFQALDLMYPEQLAWYESVLNDFGVSINHWLYIVVDTAPYRSAADGINRHLVKVWIVDENLRDQSLKRLNDAYKQYKICLERDEWPDTKNTIETIYGRKQ